MARGGAPKISVVATGKRGQRTQDVSFASWRLRACINVEIEYVPRILIQCPARGERLLCRGYTKFDLNIDEG